MQIHEIYSQMSLCLRLIRRRIVYEWGGNLEMVLLDYFTLLLIRDQLSAQSGSACLKAVCEPAAQSVEE